VLLLLLHFTPGLALLFFKSCSPPGFNISTHVPAFLPVQYVRAVSVWMQVYNRLGLCERIGGSGDWFELSVWFVLLSGVDAFVSCFQKHNRVKLKHLAFCVGNKHIGNQSLKHMD